MPDAAAPRLHQAGADHPTPEHVPAGDVLALLAGTQRLFALCAELLRDRRRAVPREALDAAELAEALGIGLRSVRTMDAGGALARPVRLGGRVVWPLAELRRWLAAGAPPREEWERLKKERRARAARKR
jgi:predicted DNA-binding transcriptional regulator AlpA